MSNVIRSIHNGWWAWVHGDELDRGVFCPTVLTFWTNVQWILFADIVRLEPSKKKNTTSASRHDVKDAACTNVYIL